MHRALALAETVRGNTSPNPAVGAAVLDGEDQLAGEGATAAGRRPARRGRRARRRRRPREGRHRGGHARAVRPHRPHRAVHRRADRGRRGEGRLRRPRPEPGRRRRRRATAGRRRGGGRRGRGHAAASGALRPWLHAVRTGRPFVTWKFAATLDGRVAAADCTSRWISSAASRADAHRLRAIVDAIIVGSGTVLADDPHLTVRDGDEPAQRQPLRVVLDRRHRLQGPYGQGARVLDHGGRDRLCWTPPCRVRPQGTARPRRAPRAARGRSDAGRRVPGSPLRRRGRRLLRADAARRRTARAGRRRHRNTRRSCDIGRRRRSRGSAVT